VAGLGQRAHTGRGQRHALLAGLDLAGHSDDHGRLMIAQSPGVRSEAMLLASPSLAFVLTFVLTGAAPAPTLAQPAPPRAVPVTPAVACTAGARPPAPPCRSGS